MFILQDSKKNVIENLESKLVELTEKVTKNGVTYYAV